MAAYKASLLPSYLLGVFLGVLERVLSAKLLQLEYKVERIQFPPLP